MTKTEAIQHGEEQLKIFGGTHREFIEMALKSLKQEPCELVQKAYEDGKKDGYVQAKVEQESCDDAISRQAVIDAIKNYASMLWERYYEPFQESTVLELIQALPSVTPIHGKMLVCPNCGLDVHSDFENCPRCGEKMIASQEKRCADCNHYGKLSLDCGRCDDDCSMFEPQESEEENETDD